MGPLRTAFTLVLLTSFPVLADDTPAEKLVGKWVWKTRTGEFDQHWVIRREDSKWTVEGRYTSKDGTEAGSFVGAEVRFSDGTLTYVHRYTKKPSANLKDGVTATLRPDGGTISYTWDNPPKGPRTLVREADTEPLKADRFVGSWQGTVDGYEVTWLIKHGAEWSVQGSYKRGGAIVGSFVGVSVKATDDTLTFARKFVKKPSTDWQDNQAVAAKVSGDGLVYNVGGGTVERAMKRQADPKEIKPDDPKAEALTGAWEGDVDGLKVVWQIAQKDGKWQVSAVYYAMKAGVAAPVGAFDGVDPVYRDGKLTFTPRYSKKPRADWFVVDTVIARVAGDSELKYTTENKGRSVSSNTLTRVKK